jgi:hypothetical protein
LGRWDEALALYEESLKTIQSLNDPRSIAVTQVSLAQLLVVSEKDPPRAVKMMWHSYVTLERLNNPREIAQMRDIVRAIKDKIGAARFNTIWQSVIEAAQPAWLSDSETKSADEDDEQAQAMRMLAQLYAQGGADAVRGALAEANVPEEVMTGLLEQLAQMTADDSAPQVSTAPRKAGLSAETVQMLVRKTVAAKTNEPDNQYGWKNHLRQLKNSWSATEVAFADALLALLDDKPASLPPDNPYSKYLDEAKAQIAHYQVTEKQGFISKIKGWIQKK